MICILQRPYLQSSYYHRSLGTTSLFSLYCQILSYEFLLIVHVHIWYFGLPSPGGSLYRSAFTYIQIIQHSSTFSTCGHHILQHYSFRLIVYSPLVSPLLLTSNPACECSALSLMLLISMNIFNIYRQYTGYIYQKTDQQPGARL